MCLMVPAPEGIGVTDRILAAVVSIPISRFGSTPVSTIQKVPAASSAVPYGRLPAPDGSASSANAPEEGLKRPATPRR